MDIACPACAATYEIDAGALGAAGRKVRCAGCGEVWLALPAAQAAEVGKTDAKDADGAEATLEGGDAGSQTAEPTQDADPEKTEAAADATPARRGARWVKGAPEKGRKRRGPGLRRLAGAAAVLLVAGGLLHQREAVVRLMPQAARLYAAVGLPVNLRGIAIRNVQSRVVGEGEEAVLVVDGDLVNVSGRRVDVPRLHFSVLGADGRPLYAWSAPADRRELDPGETLNFRRRLAAPPAAGRDVSVRFLQQSDMTAGIK